MEDEQLSNLFISEEFNAPEFVTDFLHTVRPGEEAKRLQALRQALTTRSNHTADQIKDIVFDHYRQFIDTSKEITNLEKDIYQLSALLTNQKNLIENLMEMSGLEKRSSCSNSISTNSGLHNQQNYQLQTLMNKLDGVASVLNSMDEQECILYQGQLVLLDSDTMQSKHPVYLALLSNNLLVGHPNARHMAQKHPFQLVSNYQLDSIALVNVKRVPITISGSDLTEQNLVQLLVFPEQPYLRAENARIKREWLESIEEAKRKQQEERALVRQATIRARRRNILSSIVSQKSSSSTMDGKKGTSLANQTINESEEGENNLQGKIINIEEHKRTDDAAWLSELPNELQDVLSHRHMEEAVEMLLEWKSCSDGIDPAINAKFVAIEKQVVKMLTEDLKRSGAWHGSQSLSQPIQQLIALGRIPYAIELYLRRRSAMLRTLSREFTVTEEPLSYVRQVSGLFINDIIEVCSELSQYRAQLCLVLAWSSRELNVLLSLIRRHVIEVAPTMAVLTNAWRILIGKCSRLTAIGLDLSFEINRLAAPSLRNALKINFDNIFESIKLRNSEERWTPFSLETDQNLIRFLEEMSDIKLKMEWAICRPESPPLASNPQSPFALNVSQSGCLFARTALQLSRDLAILNTSPHLQQLSDSFMCDIWSEELAHLTKGMHPSIVHHCTSRFIISQVLPLCEKIYQGGNGTGCLLNDLLMNKFSHLVHFQRGPSKLFDEGDNSGDEEEIANV